MRIVVVAFAVVPASVVATPKTRADCDANAGLCPIFIALFADVPLEVTHSVAFGAGDIAYAAEGRWLPPSWAWTQRFGVPSPTLPRAWRGSRRPKAMTSGSSLRLRPDRSCSRHGLRCVLCSV